MNYEIQKIESHRSRHHGGIFYYVFFKSEDGKSYRTCLDPKLRNFRRNGWGQIIEGGAGTIISNVRTMGNLVDADSTPGVVQWGDKSDERNKMVESEPPKRQEKEIPKARAEDSKDLFGQSAGGIGSVAGK